MLRRTLSALAASVILFSGAATATVAATVEEDGSGSVGQTVTYCLPWGACHD